MLSKTETKSFKKFLKSKQTALTIPESVLTWIDHRRESRSRYKTIDVTVGSSFFPFWTEKIVKTGQLPTKDSLSKLFTPTGYETSDFIEVKVAKTDFSSLLRQDAVKTIQNPNFKVYVSKVDFDSFLTSDTFDITLFGVLDMQIFSLFRSVTFAGEALGHTPIGLLLYSTLPKESIKSIGDFTKHESEVTVYAARFEGKPFTPDILISPNYQTYIDTFRMRVHRELRGRKCIIMTDDVVDLTDTYLHINKIFADAARYSETLDCISFDSLVFGIDSKFLHFLTDVLHIDRDAAICSMTATQYYAHSLHTTINKNVPTTIFLMDESVIDDFREKYFSNVTVKYIDIRLGDK